MKWRSLAWALALALAGLLETACGAIPLPCNVAIAALPADTSLQAGDPLPGDPLLLAGPGDFDQGAITIEADVNGVAMVNLQLRGDAIARFAAHTAGHIGEPLAIAVNERVVAVPFIRAQIPDGKIQISSGGLGGDDLANEFAGCIR